MAGCDGGPADPAIYRRPDFRVAQIDPRLTFRRLLGLQLSGRSSLRGRGVVKPRLIASRTFHQLFRPLKLNVRVVELRLSLCDRGLLRLEIGLIRRLFELVEEIALINFPTFFKIPLLEEGAYPRDDINTLGCLHTP